MPRDWSEFGSSKPNLNPSAGKLGVSFRSFILVETVKSPASFDELPSRARGIAGGAKAEFIAKKFWITPSTWNSTFDAKPTFTRISPTRVKSPRKPDKVNFAFCWKSTPAAISIAPTGVVSTSSVSSGLCCAMAKALKQKTKFRQIKRRFIFRISILASNVVFCK